MESELKYLIFHKITEKLYLERELTGFTSFALMCKGINRCLTYQTKLSRGFDTVFNDTTDYIMEIYAIPNNEAMVLLVTYFEEEAWKDYQEIVEVLLCHTKNSFQ